MGKPRILVLFLLFAVAVILLTPFFGPQFISPATVFSPSADRMDIMHLP